MPTSGPFNHPVGTPVRVAREGAPPYETITLTRPFICDNRAQIMVSGHRGAVPLNRVSVIGKVENPVPKEFTAFLTNPEPEDPGQTVLPATSMVRLRWDDPMPLSLGEALVLHEQAAPVANIDAGTIQCLVYAEIRPGAWRRVVVESPAATVARLRVDLERPAVPPPTR